MIGDAAYARVFAPTAQGHISTGARFWGCLGGRGKRRRPMLRRPRWRMVLHLAAMPRHWRPSSTLIAPRLAPWRRPSDSFSSALVRQRPRSLGFMPLTRHARLKGSSQHHEDQSAAAKLQHNLPHGGCASVLLANASGAIDIVQCLFMHVGWQMEGARKLGRRWRRGWRRGRPGAGDEGRRR